MQNKGQAILGTLGLLLALMAIGCSEVTSNEMSKKGPSTTSVLQTSPTPTGETGEERVVTDVSYLCGHFKYRLDWEHLMHFLAWTPDGSQLVYDFGSRVRMVDAAGGNLRTLAEVSPGEAYRMRSPMYGYHADVSPDGTRVVYSTCEFSTRHDLGYGEQPNRDLYNYELGIVNLDGTERQRLTQNVFIDHYPVWSPAGSRIAYIASPRSGDDQIDLIAELFTMASDGTDIRRIATAELPNRMLALAPPAWSPDGKHLAFLEIELSRGPYRKILNTVRADGTELTRLAEDVVSKPAWSPDGQKIAVAKYDGDDIALFILAADGSEARSSTTIIDRETFEGVDLPYRGWIYNVSWSPDGAHLLFSCFPTVCVVNSAGERVGEAPLLLVIDWMDGRHIAAWSPDGSRIAVYGALFDVIFGTYLSEAIVLYTMAVDGTDVQVVIPG